MKHILGRFLKNNQGEEIDLDTYTLQIPVPLPNEDIEKAQIRSFLGVIAYKLAKKLQKSIYTQGKVVYLPFAQEEIVEKREVEEEYLLYLSEQMLKSIQNGQHISATLDQLFYHEVNEAYKEAFLYVYEEVYDTLSKLLPSFVKEEEHIQGYDPIEWRVYRDVMYAATQKKFKLITIGELLIYKKYPVKCQSFIKVRSDIAVARELAKSSLEDIYANPSTLMSYILAISEAVTNVLKHAEQGSMQISVHEGKVYVIVEDSGPGFDLKLLPNTTLLAGYSTKKSLGQGFTLMMKIADQILLSTSFSGSAIILIFHINRREKWL